MLGTRADDEFIGLSTSAAISGAEFHADGALFRTPERQDDGGSFGREHMAPKLVVGSSYTFGLGTGLTLLGEYHYSGFGVRDITDALPRLADPTFRTRYVRGDMQILSRHATATQLNYQFTEALSGACLALCSPRDGSGVASPSLLWDVSDNIAIAATVFMPWGAKPNDGELHSEYGGGSRGVFLHVTAHY